MLDNHPDLAVPAETHFVFPLWRYRVRYGGLRNPENRRAIGRWLFVESKGHGGDRIRAGLSPEEAVERVVASPPTLGSVLATCFQIFADQHGKPRWGDKRPGYAGFIGTLFELFPSAQFLNVIRDPRGAVASQLPLGWDSEDAALPSALATWESSVQRVDAYSRRLRPDQLLDVRYEDLVRNPHGTMQRICGFAGLRGGEAIEAMVHGDRRGRFREGWHDRLSEPISTAPVDSWRERLGADDVALIEHVSEPYFERFGYRRAGDLGGVADPAALQELARQRRRRKRKWRRYVRDELKRKHLLYRHPLAARPPAGGAPR